MRCFLFGKQHKSCRLAVTRNFLPRNGNKKNSLKKLYLAERFNISFIFLKTAAEIRVMFYVFKEEERRPRKIALIIWLEYTITGWKSPHVLYL